MTTGTVGSPPPVGGLASGRYRTWSGSDGKYEPAPHGGVRTKWNNYSCTFLTCEVADPNFTYDWWHIVTWVAPPHQGTATFAPSVDSQWANNDDQSDKPTSTQKEKVLSKLLEEVKGFDFNLGVEVGQMNQTVSLLSDNLRKLGRSALALKRGDFATAARQLGARPRGTRLKPSDISGRWLELQYGWLPLLGSSFDAAKAFEAISKGPRGHLFTVSSARKFERDFSLNKPAYSSLLTVSVGRRIQYEMYEEMSVYRQLGLVDPLSIAWELTPWSFVVDWFVPFGTYLDLLGQIPALKGRWLVTDFAKVPKQKALHRWNDFKILEPYSSFKITRTPSSVHQITKVTRTYSASPPPVPLPKFRWGLNTPKRFWNAVSLAHQRFAS